MVNCKPDVVRHLLIVNCKPDAALHLQDLKYKREAQLSRFRNEFLIES